MAHTRIRCPKEAPKTEKKKKSEKKIDAKK